MPEFSNGLSPAQAERLAMLMEECAEVIQARGKVLRHGYDSEYNGVTNRQAVIRELTDMVVVMSFIKSDLGDDHITNYEFEQAVARKRRYMHY